MSELFFHPRLRQGVQNKEMIMGAITKEELLRIPQVVEEIKRHLWIESEQAGYDIGFDNAAEDWIRKYSIDWLKYYMPEKMEQPKSVGANSASKVDIGKDQNVKKEINIEAPKKAIKRSAKSYKK